jgi:hypothetical protein
MFLKSAVRRCRSYGAGTYSFSARGRQTRKFHNAHKVSDTNCANYAELLKMEFLLLTIQSPK